MPNGEYYYPKAANGCPDPDYSFPGINPDMSPDEKVRRCRTNMNYKCGTVSPEQLQNDKGSCSMWASSQAASPASQASAEQSERASASTTDFVDSPEDQKAKTFVELPKFQEGLRANFGVSEYSECSIVVAGIMAGINTGQLQMSGDQKLQWVVLFRGMGYMRTVFLGQGIPQSVLDDASTAWAKRWSIPSLQVSMGQECLKRLENATQVATAQ
jgi:hypothetical protein